MYKFNVKKTKENLISWLRLWFDENGENCNAIIGISGGIDSSVVSALCVEALGKDRVIGVTLPNDIQKDMNDVYLLLEHLEIKHVGMNIKATQDYILMAMAMNDISPSEQTKINLQPRLRMALLYAFSQSLNGRVMNTSNLSESWVGFDTRFGDSVGDCSPLGMLTKTEIKALAIELALPDELIKKDPADGLCGVTDEERFGFTYEELDKYIREGVIDNVKHQEKIEEMHNKNLFKLLPMPVFNPGIEE